MQEKIRVAILSNNKNLYNWQYLVLQDIQGSDYANLILNINIGDNTPSKPTWAWKSFSRLDHFLFKPSPDALTLKNTALFFNNTLEYLDKKDLDSKDLNKYKLDVIINFSDSIPTENLISSCTYGVWNLVHTSTKNKKQGPPGAWELILGLPDIGASLWTITSKIKHPMILDQTLACTDWIGYSRNANIIYWQAYPLINRSLKKLYEKRDLGCFKHNTHIDSTTYIVSPFKYPSAGILIWHSIKTLLKKILQLIDDKIYFNQWILLFSNSKKSSPYDLSEYTRILPPKDRFWADPFLIKKNGKLYLFIEELIYKDKLGHLAVMELDEEGNYTSPITILKKEYHLSYPFLFEDKGNLYMIPETGGNKDIQLYKCTNFPYEWQLEKILMKNVVAVDTTIFKKDGLYWMFTNLKVHKGMSSNIELFLFYSKELVSDQWIPHSLNPIVTDVRKSRPAGQLFMDGDNLMRPSQNCSHYYGYGLNINRVDRLDESNFHEKIIHSIEPSWKKDVLCTHTFNSCDHIHISDAKIKRSRYF